MAPKNGSVVGRAIYGASADKHATGSAGKVTYDSNATSKRADNELLCTFSGPIDRATALSAQCPLPRSPGVYAWFFKNLPPAVPVINCLRDHGRAMLYVGIAPDKPGKRISKQTLRSRIRLSSAWECRGFESGFPLRRVGSGHRMTLTPPGEQWLNNWLDYNALIYWRQHDEP
jgi:hypothetical protein